MLFLTFNIKTALCLRKCGCYMRKWTRIRWSIWVISSLQGQALKHKISGWALISLSRQCTKILTKIFIPPFQAKNILPYYLLWMRYFWKKSSSKKLNGPTIRKKTILPAIWQKSKPQSGWLAMWTCKTTRWIQKHFHGCQECISSMLRCKKAIPFFYHLYGTTRFHSAQKKIHTRLQ